MSEETKRHSPEPWYVSAGGYMCAADKRVVANSLGHIPPGDMRRIVAAINATRGISTEALEAGKLGEALDALAAIEWADNSGDEYRSQCPWCGASGRGGYNCEETTEPHGTDCARVNSLRALGRLP